MDHPLVILVIVIERMGIIRLVSLINYDSGSDAVSEEENDDNSGQDREAQIITEMYFMAVIHAVPQVEGKDHSHNG